MPITIRLIDSKRPPNETEYRNELVLNYDNWKVHSLVEDQLLIK